MHAGMGHGDGTMSVADLDTDPDRKADVVVDLTAEQGPVRLASGKTVEGYSLNGTSPGPLIEATVGDLVEVRLHNESVEGGVALHWHGVDVPNAEDGVAGVTQDAVEVGEDHTYRWVAPDAGTYWYHSHQLSNTQVSGGLLGALVVHPRKPARGVRDVVAVSHVYDGDQTVNGRSGIQRGRRRARGAGPGARGEHRQRLPARVDGLALPAAGDRRQRREPVRPRSPAGPWTCRPAGAPTSR